MISQCHHQYLLKKGRDAIGCGANEDNSDEFISANSTCTDSEYDTTEDLILFLLKHLNNLIRDLWLSKKKAELFASRLKKKYMVEKDVKVNYYRKRYRDFFRHSKLRDLFVTAMILKS